MKTLTDEKRGGKHLHSDAKRRRPDCYQTERRHEKQKAAGFLCRCEAAENRPRWNRAAGMRKPNFVDFAFRTLWKRTASWERQIFRGFSDKWWNGNSFASWSFIKFVVKYNGMFVDRNKWKGKKVKKFSKNLTVYIQSLPWLFLWHIFARDSWETTRLQWKKSPSHNLRSL